MSKEFYCRCIILQEAGSKFWLQLLERMHWGFTRELKSEAVLFCLFLLLIIYAVAGEGVYPWTYWLYRHQSKMSSSIKELCGRCSSEFVDCRYSQSCWYFRPSFVNCCPTNLLSGSTLPLSLCQSTLYTDSVWVGGGGGVLLETIFYRSLILCIWPDSEPTKLLDHPTLKPRNEGSLRQINTCCKFPLQVNLLRWRHFSFVSMYSS